VKKLSQAVQRKATGTLKYPGHALTPQDFLTFVELDEFIDDWTALGLNDEEDLFALEVAIMADPKGPDVIKGTAGLRKVRFAPSKWNVGRSHGVRVCYVYFEDFALVVLVIAYSHNEKDNLTPAEKEGIKAYIRQSHRWLSERTYR